MAIHAFLVFMLCCGFIALSFGFWLLIARDEFIDSCRRYAAIDEEPNTSTFLSKAVHSTVK